MKKLLCLLLSLTLVGCTSSKGKSRERVQKKNSVVVLNEEGKKVIDSSSKQETVNVKADAFGNIKKIKVDVSLKKEDKSDLIKDQTILSQIKNKEGDEEFNLKNGTLLWQNHNEAIRYTGTSTKKLPVDAKLSYFLDGKQVSPNEIQGKSGQVKIRVDYKNNEERTMNGYKVYVPFTVLSMLSLSEDHFDHIKVKNGKVIDYENKHMVAGLISPGLSESLNDSDIPDFIEVSATAKDFQLDFSSHIVTSGLFKNIKMSPINKIEDLQNALNTLNDQSSQLVNNASKLVEGSGAFGEGLSQYTKGTRTINNAVKKLSEALSLMSSKSAELETGTTNFNKAVQALKKSSSKETMSKILSLSNKEKELGEKLSEMKNGIASYKKLLDVIEKEDLSKTQEQLANGVYNDIEEKMKNVLNETSLTADEKERVLSLLKSSLKESETLKQISDSYSHIYNACKDVKKVDMSSLTKLLDNMKNDVDELRKTLPNESSVKDLAGQVNALADGSEKIAKAMKAYKEGNQKIAKMSKKLSDGSDTLCKHLPQLEDGYQSLAKGMRQFAQGLTLFHEKGISQLASLSTGKKKEFIKKIKAIREADVYDNYSGKMDQQKSSVRFIIETDEIKKDES